jgi:hypothetical protein
MLTLDQRLRPHPDAVDTELDTNEVVLLHLESKTYYTLNRTGLRIWQGVKEGLSLREVSGRLQKEFEIDPDKADESVLRIADELSREKLVELPAD